MLVKLVEDYQITLVKGDDVTDQKVNIKGYTETLPSSGSKSLWSLDSDHFNPTTAVQLKVKSDNTDDTSNGTGARTIQITGIGYSSDANNGTEVTETITLNGTTAVSTTNYYYCVFDFIVATVGNTGKNQGNIKIYSTDETTEIVNYIKKLENNSSLCIYRVPISTKLLVKNILVNGTCNGANLHLKVKNENGIEFSEFIFRIGTFGGQLDFTVDKILNAQSVIWIKIIPDSDIPSSTTNCGISAIINGVLY